MATSSPLKSPVIVAILHQEKWRKEHIVYVIIALMSLIPKNVLSFWMGKFCRLRFPNQIKDKLLLGFVRLFRIDMSEAEKDLKSYETFEELFGRALKPGSRPITDDVISPADGIVVSHAVRYKNLAIQAKGLYYELGELVFGANPSESEKENEFSWYSTVYLAPHNYHRVHVPVTGKLLNIRYVPGSLWPVSLGFVRNFPRLFVVNERLVFDIQTEHGMVFVVMVGATNVGRMRTPYLSDFVTNEHPFQIKSAITNEYPMDPAIALHAGDELGTFLLGSTVVVVFEKGFPVEGFQEVTEPCKIKMGESLKSI